MHVATNYKDVFDYANDAIFIHDEQTGAILDANRMASNLTGFSVEQLRQMRVGDISAGGGVSRSDLGAGLLPGETSADDSFILGSLLSFEIDLWGRLANADKAARQQLLAVQANAQTVALGVTAETASNHFAIATLNEQISITH